ncbi:hypothetical protein GY15_03395 [Delftia sp. 670]|nr:hypothetical protein GY15_03395 [Delftia sp. 670]
MLALQALHQGHGLRIALLQQRREDMQLLVLMVQRRRLVEVAQDVARRLACAVVATFGPEMHAQPVQQRQHAQHALVAGFEHLEGLVEARAGRAPAGHGIALRALTHQLHMQVLG